MSKFSVIIPTLNEERHIGYLPSDIAGQTRKPDEVLVLDADSKDGTLPVVRWGEKRQRSLGRSRHPGCLTHEHLQVSTVMP